MKNDGGPAFPYSALTPEGPQIYGDSKGMSLRDWFAGQMATGIFLKNFGIGEASQIAKRCYEFADAMIAERDK